MNERIPEYLLERLSAGDLPPQQAESLRRRLGREADGASRLQALRTSDAATLATHPSTAMAEAIRRRAELASAARRRASRRGFAFGFPATAIAALGLGLWLRAPGPGSSAPSGGAVEQPGERIKGLAPRLLVYRHGRGAGKNAVERLSDGDPTRDGDELQLAYLAAGHRFGAVLSIDGKGEVTRHLADASGGSVPLRTDGEIALPEAYQLDAAPGFERFAFVASDSRISGQVLGEWIRGLGKDPALQAPRSPAPDAAVTFFTVRKDAGGAHP